MTGEDVVVIYALVAQQAKYIRVFIQQTTRRVKTANISREQKIAKIEHLSCLTTVHFYKRSHRKISHVAYNCVHC